MSGPTSPEDVVRCGWRNHSVLLQGFMMRASCVCVLSVGVGDVHIPSFQLWHLNISKDAAIRVHLVWSS